MTVDRAVLVFEQHERDALRGPRSLSRDDDPTDPHARAMRELLERTDVGRPLAAKAGAEQSDRVHRGGQPGRRVVGDHRVPRRQRPELWRGRQVERELRPFAAIGLHAGRRNAELPQRNGRSRPASASQAPDHARCTSAGRPAPAREARSSSETRWRP
jgi:hypothetical protein